MGNSAKGFSSKALIFLVFIIAAVLLLLNYTNLGSWISKNILVKNSKPILILPKPTPTTQNTDVHSPDGTMKVILRAKEENSMMTYSFFVDDILGKNEKFIFTKNVNPNIKMAVPLNSWSPDNKYLFLIENKNGTINALIFKASTESFANNQQYLDIESLFAQHKNKHYVTDVTGWASPTLLYVTTASLEDNKKGPTFWFDMDSKTFIQLY